MENQKFRNMTKFQIVLIAHITFLIIIKMAFHILNTKFHLYILISNINQVIVNLIINIVIVVSVVLLLNIKAKRVRKYIQNVCASLLIIYLIFLYFFADSGKSYFYFQSPDQTKMLVVEEDTWLIADGRCNFYSKEGIFVKGGGGITTNNGGRPFTSNSYELKWLDNSTVELNYFYGRSIEGPIYKSCIINMEKLR